MEWLSTNSPIESMNLKLHFLLDDIKYVVWSCACDKRPGLDYFNMAFYTTSQDIIKLNLWECVQEFFLTTHLIFFELPSCLGVNFHKIKVMRFNVEPGFLEAGSGFLFCPKSYFPFIFVRIPIEIDPFRCSSWDSILAKLRNKLVGWKAKHILMGGLVTLLISVLSSIPFSSFFSADLLIQFLRKFLTFIDLLYVKVNKIG